LKSRFHKLKMKLFCKIANPHSLMFHIAGIACLVWFIARVLPKPDRIYYPCQQISMTVATSYIIFWGIIWTALFHGLAIWVRRAKTKTTAVLPAILVSFVLIFSVSSGVFANNDEKSIGSWEPIPNEPIGTPRGVNPGRVVWVWNPNATESNLRGFWWSKHNNNQDVIDEMFTDGIKGLAGINDIEDAWDALFRHFNSVNGNGDIGYQPGEKIAIKVNLNNCFQFLDYFILDNDRDASPFVVKSLLRQLINNVGVAQEDITVYDASRVMPNWFYNRVFYKTFPALIKEKEFPNVNFVDALGTLRGREKVKESPEKIYFADGTGITKTLPICVAEASYIINMPLLKRHPIDMGVTLSAKNFFGTWIEPVFDIHPYHRAAFTSGNPAPQVDLLAHENIGRKTVLFVGDGTFGTKIDHKTIGKFQMYPFNNDWTNSLFFSQDPVALDSVMYDFLHTDGADPCEGSQNYMHQSAVPLPDTYDPENDGEFLSESLGVHEHWNKSFDIFSADRYLGPSGNGIDFVAIGEEHASSGIVIVKPKAGYLYINSKQIFPIGRTIVIGDIIVEAEASNEALNIDYIYFYLNDELVHADDSEPYEWHWGETKAGKYTVKVVGSDSEGESFSDEMVIWKIR